MAIKISAKLESKIKKNLREVFWAISQQSLSKKQSPTNQDVLNYLINLMIEAATDHNADLKIKCKNIIEFPSK